MSDVTPVLVDARTVGRALPELIAAAQAAPITGIDLETQDSGRHAGLNAFMGMNLETGRKAGNRPLVFDVNRTVITGVSFYPDGHDKSYYLNLAHADVENRIPFAAAQQVLSSKREGAIFVAHNAMFEKTMLSACHGVDLEAVCTMQMAVSAYAKDEYSAADFQSLSVQPIMGLIKAAAKPFANFDRRNGMNQAQAEIFGKFCGKETDAAHSYNGWIETIARPYDLKRLVRYAFGHQMTTFEQVLGDKRHMGELTGEETVAYGADDAYWAVKLYHWLLAYMLNSNPNAVEAFFTQENPVIDAFVATWRDGVRIDGKVIEENRAAERIVYAAALRKMREAIRALLPFGEVHEGLSEEKWYRDGVVRYRHGLLAWANEPEQRSDGEEALAVRGAISNAWAAEDGLPEPKGLSITHYMPARVMMYDLTGQKCIKKDGKVASNAEARGKLLDRMRRAEASPRLSAAIRLVEAMGELAGVETRAKLYLNPYRQLIDPDTSRVYPVTSSKLATRRLSMSTPNGTQLAKWSEGAYIRSTYVGDDPKDDVVISADWSGIELVAIAEESQDPEFRKAFGQIPYDDLHLGAAVSILNAEHPEAGLTDDVFKLFKNHHAEVPGGVFHNIPLYDSKGNLLTPSKFFKFNRGTDGGKGANFNYWYSGALSALGDKRGWSPDMMWAATEQYRNRFPVAEAWRMDTIRFGQAHGYVEIRDGHRRVRLEATDAWAAAFRAKFAGYYDQGIQNFINEAARKIQRRAHNQLVNAKIQGMCAAMMKRAIYRLRRRLADASLRARYMFSIHDEMLISSHRDDVFKVIAIMRECMCDQRGIIDTLPLNVNVAVGRHFQLFEPTKAPLGQIELDEAPEVLWIPKELWGKKLPDERVAQVIDYLFAPQALQVAA